MNTLWVYGCSFTQGMWEYDYKQGKDILSYPTHSGRHKEYIQGSKKNWASLLATSINYNLINRGLERSGPLHAIEMCMEDCNKWKKNDIIIFQVSFMNRLWDIYKKEIIQHGSLEYENNQYIWVSGFFELLSKQYEIKWYWWSVEDIPLINSKHFSNLLKFNNFNCYKDWMFSDKSLFYDYFVGENCVDYHQNLKSHYLQFQFFKNQI